METKHTPGPWLIQESTVYALNERRPPVNRFHASVDSGFDNCDKRISREEVCANAKLIAAAPELLEALLESRQVIATALKVGAPDWFDTDEKVAEHTTVKKIDAAISKATA